ncbi:MAG: hypothetical protein AAFY35_12155 [Pseudomonadota bacterium]
MKVKKIFVLLLGGTLSLALALLVLPGQIVDFQKNLSQALSYLSNAVYRTQFWSGKFDRYPEGQVDMNSLGIETKVDAALEIEVVGISRINGRVWWQGSCAFGGPYSGLLLDGQIKMGGSYAEVTIWELVGGRRVDLANGTLMRDGQVVEFREFPDSLGLNGSAIAKNPEPALLDDWQNLYCE